MPLTLASSAIPGFDLIDTVDTAYEENFESVQLFINNSILNPEYREVLIGAIKSQNITSVVIHLPNVADITEELVAATQLLVDGVLSENTHKDKVTPPFNGTRQPISVVGLIHYEDEVKINFPGLTTSVGDRTKPFLSIDIPRFNNMVVGVENSKTREFDVKHVMNTLKFARAHDIPFVFDIGRIMYPIKLKGEKEASLINENIRKQIIRFIKLIIGKMDPKRDIIHTSGKTEFGKFRDYACALGAEGDITEPLMDDMNEFILNGGIVVLEHEDLKQALDSRSNLEG